MNQKRKLAVVMAAHTDDAEFGAGGAIINLIRAGYDVIMGNMVDGGGRSAGLQSAQMTGAGAEWLGFEANAVEDSPASFGVVKAFLDRHQPDLIFTHWPIDEHPDHRATGSLTIRYVDERQKILVDREGVIHPGEYCPRLYFYEAISGKQTKCFTPDLYVDFDKNAFELKKRLMQLYTGTPMTSYMKSAYQHHLLMMEFRARESGACRHGEIDGGIWAEAFAMFPLARGQERIVLPGER
jgi:LmbE family N-acetylglucosaminyl deacetylase